MKPWLPIAPSLSLFFLFFFLLNDESSPRLFSCSLISQGSYFFPLLLVPGSFVFTRPRGSWLRISFSLGFFYFAKAEHVPATHTHSRNKKRILRGTAIDQEFEQLRLLKSYLNCHCFWGGGFSREGKSKVWCPAVGALYSW